MDKIVDHLFVFEGNGVVTDFPGNYTIYRNKVLEEKVNSESKKVNPVKEESKKEVKKSNTKRKLSFNEKREFEQLETEIAELEEKITKSEELLNSGGLPHGQLYEKSEELGKMKEQLDEKEFRWLELSEREQ
jgi:ATP-binding cassette subfamily F protein uup